MLQEAINAWLLEHPEEEEQWLQVRGMLRSLGLAVVYCTGPNFWKGKKQVGEEGRYFVSEL
jgi:hypothetical protein